MSREQLINMARELGLPAQIYAHPGVLDLLRRATAGEREACAVLCEHSDRYRGDYFAAKIRARSND